MAHPANQPKLTVHGSHRQSLYAAAGVLTLIAGWQVMSMWMHPAIVASPVASLLAFYGLGQSGLLWRQLLITLQRLGISLCIGCGIGLTAGLLAGTVPRIRSFLEPIRWVAMTLPAIVIAVLGMLWFGMGGGQAIFLVAFIVTPVVYVNTVGGILDIDPQLLEMGRTYRFSRRLLLSQIYLPGIALPIISGLTLATGIGVRGIILAELLGAFDGVGHSFSHAWTHLKTDDMFAWVMAALALMAVLEFCFLQPVRRRLRRWQASTVQ